jgi:hypothetical protein
MDSFINIWTQLNNMENRGVILILVIIIAASFILSNLEGGGSTGRVTAQGTGGQGQGPEPEEKPDQCKCPLGDEAIKVTSCPAGSVCSSQVCEGYIKNPDGTKIPVHANCYENGDYEKGCGGCAGEGYYTSRGYIIVELEKCPTKSKTCNLKPCSFEVWEKEDGKPTVLVNTINSICTIA